jgi:hypothetical protein
VKLEIEPMNFFAAASAVNNHHNPSTPITIPTGWSPYDRFFHSLFSHTGFSYIYVNNCPTLFYIF